MRIVAATAPLIILAACSSESAPPPGDQIECALGAGAEFEAVCTLEQASDDGETLLVIHHPDGGFRRLTVLSEGKGVAATDGAGALAQSLSGDRLDVAIDGDRYRLPVKPMSAPSGD